MPRFQTKALVMVIILDLSHPIVWLVRHMCSDKAVFSFLQKETTFYALSNVYQTDVWSVQYTHDHSHDGTKQECRNIGSMNCNFSVTLTKSLHQSSIKPCLIIHLVAMWTLKIYIVKSYNNNTRKCNIRRDNILSVFDSQVLSLRMCDIAFTLVVRSYWRGIVILLWILNKYLCG